MKFGIVGVVAFIIDWGLMNILLMTHMHNVLATSISFFVSLIFNYLASKKFVFKHRPDTARRIEITIYYETTLLSTSWMPHDSMYSMHTRYVLWTNVGKLVATVVVMIWNFVIRKWLLDDTHTNAMNRLRKSENRLSQEELEAKWENSFSHRLGLWSLAHTPEGWPK